MTNKPEKSREAVVLDIMSETMAYVALGNDEEEKFTIVFEFDNDYEYNTALSIAGEAGFVPVSIHDDKNNWNVEIEFAPAGEIAQKMYKTHESNFTDGDLYELLNELDHYTHPYQVMNDTE
jgi:hypothetical protein